jgi:multiple sugar transport system substrate-binding protein
LTWYINPDNGGQAELAERCSQASGGRYRIRVSVLPNDATSQREQLVRRLAARDESIDLMSLDLPFVPELAAAGFLRPFRSSDADELTRGVLSGPAEAGRWAGKLFGAPFWANTQLLWFRKSVGRRTGLKLAHQPVTWRQLIDAAIASGTTVEVQARRYEGYMVWINALVASSGGRILLNPEAGKHVTPGIDSHAGRKAAAIIGQLARSAAANPALSTADEEVARQSFQSSRGAFMVNWPYVYGAAQAATASGALDRAVFDDIAWARYPRIEATAESRPPLGGIVLAVGAYARNPELSVDAIRCIASIQSQTRYMLRAKLPAARSVVYDDPEVRRAFPMADLIRDSIATAAPRPLTPYYTDVSAAVVRSFHPPDAVDPEQTPAAAARLIVSVLHDRVLL